VLLDDLVGLGHVLEIGHPTPVLRARCIGIDIDIPTIDVAKISGA
jgi:hypothetical protein